MEDEIRGELARKIRERELAADRLGAEQAGESRMQSDSAPLPQAITRLAAAGLWALVIAVGVATGSVPAAIATLVGGYLAIVLVALGRRLFGGS